MRRRHAPSPTQAAGAPVEVWAPRFFFLALRSTPRCGEASRAAAASGVTRPLTFPTVPGVQFLALDGLLSSPEEEIATTDGGDRALDARHTIRACRVLNALRRRHGVGSPVTRVHFYLATPASQRREPELVQLLVRWRLLCVGLPPPVAVGPFAHLPGLLDVGPWPTLGALCEGLSGLAKGLASELLVTANELEPVEADVGRAIGSVPLQRQCQRQQQHEETMTTTTMVDEVDGDRRRRRPPPPVTRITRRFLVFASPVDPPPPPPSPLPSSEPLTKSETAEAATQEATSDGGDRLATSATASATADGPTGGEASELEPEAQPPQHKQPEMEESPSSSPPSTPACDVESESSPSSSALATRRTLDIAGPRRRRLGVAELVPILRGLGVAVVVRLSAAPAYDDQLLIRNGIEHLDLALAPAMSSWPEPAVISRFLECCENAPGIVAVHGSSDAGRAAFCIGCFLIKHLGFTAHEALGWLRFCRPGALTGRHEQTALAGLQAQLWRDGDEYRRREQRQELARSPSSGGGGGGRSSSSSVVGGVDDIGSGGGAGSPSSSHISIGKITLGRDSLLGTASASAKRLASASIAPMPKGGSTTTTSSSGNSRMPPRGPGSLSDVAAWTQQLVATDPGPAVTRRRPMTQGAIVGRRGRDHHGSSSGGTSGGGGSSSGSGGVDSGGSLRADFAAMHKFLHSHGTSGGGSSSSNSVTPQRPASTAPSSGSGSGSSSGRAATTTTTMRMMMTRVATPDNTL